MTLEEIFKSLLMEGLERLQLELSIPAQNYLGNLLHSYIQADTLFEMNTHSGKKNIAPLAEAYLKAQEVSLSERLVSVAKNWG